MTRLALQVAGAARPSCAVETVWRAVDTVPALTSLIGLVEQCVPIDEGWRWDLGQRGALGLTVQVSFDVTVTHVPMRLITFQPVGDAARWASGEGRIEVAPDGDATSIDVALDLDLDLPLPRLLASPISRTIQREVQHAVDDLLRRWIAQVGG